MGHCKPFASSRHYSGDCPQAAATATAAVFLTAEDAKYAEEVVFDPLSGLSGLGGKM
jgi:hypothetical protein